LRQIGVAKTEPGDENNQDISALVGKIDIRKLEHYSQHDPDAYSYSGGLNRTTQGCSNSSKCSSADQGAASAADATRKAITGTEKPGRLAYQGVILAHSNESEWEQFKNNKNNERSSTASAWSRFLIASASRGIDIYAKLLEGSDLAWRRARRGVGDSRPVLHPVAHQGAPELAALLQDARL